MKTLTLLALSLLLNTIVSFGQESGSIFLIRHAEVDYVDGNRNPDLSDAGKNRGAVWAKYFGNTEFVKIFSTNLNRTTQTAEYIAREKGLEIEFYDPFAKESVDAFEEASKKGNVLVVGHSNTVPTHTNALFGTEKFEQLGEKDYNNVFMVINPTSKAQAYVFKVD